MVVVFIFFCTCVLQIGRRNYLKKKQLLQSREYRDCSLSIPLVLRIVFKMINRRSTILYKYNILMITQAESYKKYKSYVHIFKIVHF